MILYIDTTEMNVIRLGLAVDRSAIDQRRFAAETKTAARFDHAEKLLPQIRKICLKAGAGIADLESICVNNRNGGFTALRIGVVTANALGYALGIPVSGANDGEKLSKGKLKFTVIKPEYDREPNITYKK